MHNTGNPIGSDSLLDLYDNSSNIDQYVNSQEDTFPDRFGTKRLTLAGLIKRSMALRNEINDFSGALTFKPEWSDVPMNVSEGVGGEGGALNLQAEALGNRTEINKVTSRETLRRSYAEAGYNLVSGSFEAGGTLVNANDVLLHEVSGKAFSGPSGAVAAGTNPSGGGFVDRSDSYAQSINVKNFGAKGDGVADDTIAFESASISGKALVPDGIYKLSRNVIGHFELGDNVVFTGKTVLSSSSNAKVGKSSQLIANIPGSETTVIVSEAGTAVGDPSATFGPNSLYLDKETQALYITGVLHTNTGKRALLIVWDLLSLTHTKSLFLEAGADYHAAGMGVIKHSDNNFYMIAMDDNIVAEGSAGISSWNITNAVHLSTIPRHSRLLPPAGYKFNAYMGFHGRVVVAPMYTPDWNTTVQEKPRQLVMFYDTYDVITNSSDQISSELASYVYLDIGTAGQSGIGTAQQPIQSFGYYNNRVTIGYGLGERDTDFSGYTEYNATTGDFIKNNTVKTKYFMQSMRAHYPEIPLTGYEMEGCCYSDALGEVVRYELMLNFESDGVHYNVITRNDAFIAPSTCDTTELTTYMNNNTGKYYGEVVYGDGSDLVTKLPLTNISDIIKQAMRIGCRKYIFYTGFSNAVVDLQGRLFENKCIITIEPYSVYNCYLEVKGTGGVRYGYRITSADTNPTMVGSVSPIICGGEVDSDYDRHSDGGGQDMCWFNANRDFGFKYKLRASANMGRVMKPLIALNQSSVEVGSIVASETGVMYNTASDPRLKTDFIPMTAETAWNIFDGIYESSGLFRFKDAPDTEILGFDAHKLYDVCPNAVTATEGDRSLPIGHPIQVSYINDDGETELKAGKVEPYKVDQSKLVPYLVQTIADLKLRIELLEKR